MDVHVHDYRFKQQPGVQLTGTPTMRDKIYVPCAVGYYISDISDYKIKTYKYPTIKGVK